MNYFVIRDGQQYGPYSVADIQRYVAQGNIALTDQARSEGIEQTITVAQIVGSIPMPSAAPQQTYGQVPGYIPSAEMAQAPSSVLPPPLHWGLLLLLMFVTLGLFAW